MISIALYAEAEKSLWDEFVRGSKNGTFLHERGYVDYHRDRFVDHSLIFRDAKDRLVGLLPANRDGDVLKSHQGLTYGGLVVSEKMRAPLMLEMFAALRGYLRDHGFTSLIYKSVPSIYHQHPAEEDRYALFRSDARIIGVNLSVAIEQSAPIALSSRRRRGVRRGQAAGVRVSASSDFDEYFQLVNELLKWKYDTAAVHTTEEMERLKGLFPDNIQLQVARSEEGDILAGVLLYLTDTVAHVQYIASSHAGRACGALDVLFNQLIQLYEGKKYFDFGTSNQPPNCDLNIGLITQKEEFGARGIVYPCYEVPAAP